MGNYGVGNRRRCGGALLVKKTKSAVIAKRIMIISIIAAITVYVILLYINDYYKATDKAQKAMLGSEVVVVEEFEDYYLFSQNPAGSYVGKGAGKGIVFYPGGKVDEKAYAPLLLKFAENGYVVYLVKMPAKLAVFGANAAEGIMEKEEHIEHWTMMGHSLGGAMAADFSASHDEMVDALVLLAAYSLEDLNDLEMDVYSFYGSEDLVLNMEKYEECYKNLPDDVIEAVIEGGNHAYYAYYGEQEGDGTAGITREEQQECVLDLFFYGKK